MSRRNLGHFWAIFGLFPELWLKLGAEYSEEKIAFGEGTFPSGMPVSIFLPEFPGLLAGLGCTSSVWVSAAHIRRPWHTQDISATVRSVWEQPGSGW